MLEKILTSSEFVTVASLVVAVLTAVTAYSMNTTSYHHRRLGERMASMEGVGYFSDRQNFLKGRLPRAPKVIENLMWVVCAIFIVIFVYNCPKTFGALKGLWFI